MIGKLPFAALASLLALGQSATADESWSYSGAGGPDSWGRISAACSAGATQSPINIEGTEPVIMNRLEMNYDVTPLSLVNDGHTVRANYGAGSWLGIGAKRFDLKEFHFHTPAEHSVLGAKSAMEIHFFHEAQDGSLAVVAALVREGRSNLAAEEIWPHLPLESGQNMELPDVKINARDLMPNNRGYFRYMGSLETPPCTEGVNWYILKQPVEFSAQQIAAIKGIMGENARPQQPRLNRIILDAQPQ